MSKGPGKVERAIRAEVAELRRHQDRVEFTTSDICHAAFDDEGEARLVYDDDGDVVWTKSRQVSALRAMHRIVAAEPGWAIKRSRHAPLQFVWEWQRSGPDGTAPKQQRLHEPILACPAGREELVWDQAVIVARGHGPTANRVTVDYNGTKYRCNDGADGSIYCRQFWGRFCHERARTKVEAEARWGPTGHGVYWG
jgi:hypothetical protein